MSYTIPDAVIWTDDDDEIRLYDSARGEFETLNSTAAAIWRLADQGRTAAEIAAELGTAFDAQDDAQRRGIARDVEEFLGDLVGRGLLVSRKAAGAAAG
jgi:hypothetical protein